jgi:hypothetical protein
MLKELLEFDSAIYTVRPVNWLSELANTEFPVSCISFYLKVYHFRENPWFL